MGLRETLEQGTDKSGLTNWAGEVILMTVPDLYTVLDVKFS